MKQSGLYNPLVFSRPSIMGVINCTPDSFSDGNRYATPDDAVATAMQYIKDGASIIDIGGESSRPGATPISAEEEWRRIEPVLRKLREQSSILISIDTYKTTVMEKAEKYGANIINDISAGSDVNTVSFMKNSDTAILLMHMQGIPETMQDSPSYRNVCEEVYHHLDSSANRFIAGGVDATRIAIDPGIGFGKTFNHNLTLLKNLSMITDLPYTCCVGVSRKKVTKKLAKLEDTDPIEKRLPASLFLTELALKGGAAILRTHDVAITAGWIAARAGYADWLKKEPV